MNFTPPPSSALVIIDMQKNVLHPDEYTQAGQPRKIIQNVDSVLFATRMLLDTAVSNILHVLHIPQFLSTPYRDPVKRSVEYGVDALIDEASEYSGYSHAELESFKPHPIAAPVYGELMFTKESYNAFAHKKLVGFLYDLHIQHLIFAGVKADICVFESALQAIREGFSVSILRDCVAATRIQDKKRALNRLQNQGAELITSKKYMKDYLRIESSSPAPEQAEPISMTKGTQQYQLDDRL